MRRSAPTSARPVGGGRPAGRRRTAPIQASTSSVRGAGSASGPSPTSSAASTVQHFGSSICRRGFTEAQATKSAGGVVQRTASKYHILVGGCGAGHRKITVTANWSGSQSYTRAVSAGTTAPGNYDSPTTAAFGVEGVNRNGTGPYREVMTECRVSVSACS